MKDLRFRFWAEAVTGGASALAFVAFLLWPTWIESLFEVSPDGGSGETELFAAAGLLLVAIICSLLMRAEIRRRATATAAR